MKIGPIGAELFHADGRADMTKLIVPFRNFAFLVHHVNGVYKVIKEKSVAAYEAVQILVLH